MDYLPVIISFIYGYIFVPFAICNLLYVVVKQFNKSKTLQATADFGEQIFYTAGVVYFIVFLINTLRIYLYYNGSGLFEKYTESYWTQASIWIICSQLLRYDFIRKYSIFRILISVFVLISIHYYAILASTISRDYPYVEWVKLFKPSFIYAILFTKSFVFGFFCYAYVLRKEKRRNAAILDEEIK